MPVSVGDSGAPNVHGVSFARRLIWIKANITSPDIKNMTLAIDSAAIAVAFMIGFAVAAIQN